MSEPELTTVEMRPRRQARGRAWFAVTALALLGVGAWILSGLGETRVYPANRPTEPVIVARPQPRPLAGPPYIKPVGPPAPNELTPDTDQPPSTGEVGAQPSPDDLENPEVRPLPQAAPPASVPPGLVTAHLFGKDVFGLDPEMVRRLESVEQQLASESRHSGEPSEVMFGVASISGYRAGSRGHSRGVAVDINYYANAYIMHEVGEAQLDAQLKPVYHRMARFMLGRDSVIPEQITEGSPSPERALKLHQQLMEESRAMAAYFNLMPNREAIVAQLKAARPPLAADPDHALIPGTPHPNADDLQRQMMADYVTLSGRPGPPVPGLEYPSPVPAFRTDRAGKQGDALCGRPFEGDPRYRAPEYGFMNLRKDLVQALTDAGLRWGAVDFGGQSGDVMHFYLPDKLMSRRPTSGG